MCELLQAVAGLADDVYCTIDSGYDSVRGSFGVLTSMESPPPDSGEVSPSQPHIKASSRK